MTRVWLKQIRAERSLTQATLAASAGIKPARYSRIEAGYCDLRDEEAASLAKALNQTVEFIQCGTEQTKTTKAENIPANSHPKPIPAPEVSKPIEITKSPAPTPKGLSAAHAAGLPLPSTKGDDLSDPKNFTLMPPPLEALARDGLTPADFKTRLQQHNTFAEKVLHTSKVSPRIWVAWRDFNKEVQALMRTGTPPSAIAPPVNPKPFPIQNPVIPATPNKPTAVNPPAAKTLSRSARGNKNIFGYFVEVAKESLPPEKYAVLDTLATEAKTRHPEQGFMKHFRRLAEAELPPADFSRIAAEAEHRFSL